MPGSPSILRSYPVRPKNRQERYEFEHGYTALWRQVARSGKPVRLITWYGEYDCKHWRDPKNGIWKGDQSDLIFSHNHSDHFMDLTEKEKLSWTAIADTKFK